MGEETCKMSQLKGSKTEHNLKEAFAGESQANRRYLYFAICNDLPLDQFCLFRRINCKVQYTECSPKFYDFSVY